MEWLEYAFKYKYFSEALALSFWLPSMCFMFWTKIKERNIYKEDEKNINELMELEREDYRALREKYSKE